MSLTSYRAAPPRGKGRSAIGELALGGGFLWPTAYRRAYRLTVKRKLFPFFAGLATTYSPMSFRQSTIGAKAFDGRVRDGIGSDRLARAARPAKNGIGDRLAVIGDQKRSLIADLRKSPMRSKNWPRGDL
jgi:hypothetical protein